MIITLIKWSIPNENSTEDYNYFNILYIIQIIFSSLPSLGVVIFILVGFFISSGLKDFFDWIGNENESRFVKIPLHDAGSAPPNVYPEDWAVIYKKLRLLNV